MRVFGTGGTGHSGSYIVPELSAAGHEVRPANARGHLPSKPSAMG
jgi:uncharacterized protein YbjT (DUF2867 family)